MNIHKSTIRSGMHLLFSAVLSTNTAWAADIASALSLEGKIFEGKLKIARGLFGFIDVEDSFIFEDGTFIWESGKSGGYAPAPYSTEVVGSKLLFRAHSERVEGDFVDWVGTFDGEVLSEVEGVWTRVEDDFIHNLLLPRKVTFIFSQ